MTQCHVLKTDPNVFQDSWDEKKQFETRFNDRNFRLGDILFLAETIYSGEEMKKGKPLQYTGRLINQDIIYKSTGYGLQEGWCILGTALIMVEEMNPLDNDFLELIEA